VPGDSYHNARFEGRVLCEQNMPWDLIAWGLLYSYYDLANKSDTLFFPGGNEAAKGAVRMVLDSAHPCGFLMDHMLTPEYLNGKNIIGQYAKAADIMVSNGKNTEILKKYSNQAYGIDEKTELSTQIKPAVTRTKYGKGNIVAVYYNIFEAYCEAADFYVRNMMSRIIDDLDGEKFIEYKGQKFVDIVPCRKDGKLMINLINTGGVYCETKLRAYDEIQALSDIEITIKTKKAPGSVVLQPGNIIPNYAYDAAAQRLTVKINRLDIHTIVAVDI
jgi:hypothetical protein